MRMRDANAFTCSWSLVLISLLVVGTMPTPVLAQAGQSSETDSSSIPELQESSRGEISADSGEETWTRQLAFQTARSVDSFVEGLEADLGEPVRDHSRIRKRWAWSGVSFPGLPDSTTTIRVEALVVHDPTPSVYPTPKCGGGEPASRGRRGAAANHVLLPENPRTGVFRPVALVFGG